MPDIQDTLNIPERLMNEQYEMYVLYIDDDTGVLRDKGAVVLQADALIEDAGAGIVKLKLTNVIVDPMNRIRLVKRTNAIPAEDAEIARKEFIELLKPPRRKADED